MWVSLNGKGCVSGICTLYITLVVCLDIQCSWSVKWVPCLCTYQYTTLTLGTSGKNCEEDNLQLKAISSRQQSYWFQLLLKHEFDLRISAVRLAYLYVIVTCWLDRSHTWSSSSRLRRRNVHQQITKEGVGGWWGRSLCWCSSDSRSCHWLGGWRCFLSLGS